MNDLCLREMLQLAAKAFRLRANKSPDKRVRTSCGARMSYEEIAEAMDALRQLMYEDQLNMEVRTVGKNRWEVRRK